MKIVKNSSGNCHFYSHEILLYIVWACLLGAGHKSESTLSPGAGVPCLQMTVA